MALLIILLAFLSVPSLYAQNIQDAPLRVVFDHGNPDNSVGIMGERVLEKGDYFEGYRVLAFEEEAVVFQDTRTQDSVKFVHQGVVDPDLAKHARRLFVVKQMKAVYVAQARYLEQFRDHFARDLESLIHHGFLPNGFQEGVKQDYFFEISESKKSFNEEPTFLAIAAPRKELGRDLFFAVDQLGSVRYGDTRFQVPWGPVWDYADHGKPTWEFIGVDAEP